MQNCLFIGVDVALKGNQFCVMNFDQHIYFNLKFPNNPEGNNMVINKIKDIENKFFFEKIIIVMESTGMYSFHPACYLSSNEYLNNFHTEVYQINACDFDKYKKSFHDLEKEDGIDLIFLPTMQELVELSLYTHLRVLNTLHFNVLQDKDIIFVKN